jgi:hypothetical protein
MKSRFHILEKADEVNSDGWKPRKICTNLESKNDKRCRPVNSRVRSVVEIRLRRWATARQIDPGIPGYFKSEPIRSEFALDYPDATTSCVFAIVVSSGE